MEQDDDLIYFFEHFEMILDSAKPTAESIAKGVDFEVFSRYFVSDIRTIQQRLMAADDEYLLYVCEHLFNLIDWIELIVENRSEAFREAFEDLFDTVFGDKKIVHTIYDTSFNKWLVGKNGQYKIGANTYSVMDSTLYYRNRFKQWFKVPNDVAFDSSPPKDMIDDETLIAQLNDAYEDTAYDLVIKKWESKEYKGSLPPDFSHFDERVTTPEDYFEFTTTSIAGLINNPVSIAELERWAGEEIPDLEDKIKLYTTALDMVQQRRKDDSYTIYLLRDCTVFYEMHKTLDILSSQQGFNGQLLIGRKALSNKPEQWGYYIVILEVLYEAHKRYSHDFSDFYEEFARLLDVFASVNTGFRRIIDEVVMYINKNIRTDKKRIVIFDVGFQGSINLFIKYVIDRYVHAPMPHSELQVEIEVGVGAEWSKELFGKRIKNGYFPFLDNFQRLARSDELYHYVFGSLDNGGVQVTMGSEQWQRKAAIDLVVHVMVTQLAQSDSSSISN